MSNLKEFPSGNNLTLNVAPTQTSTPSATRLPSLNPPGPESNYLNWEIVVHSYFTATGVLYVLTPTKPELRPATWEQDNNTVCSIILLIAGDANIDNIRHLRGNAAEMWSTLRSTHLDNSTGGKLYWVQKLVTCEFSGGDIETHLTQM
ncbi:hypothetical protein PSTG_19005, partial [Puccinia striiformis f. sp. tritici PST-78]